MGELLVETKAGYCGEESCFNILWALNRRENAAVAASPGICMLYVMQNGIVCHAIFTSWRAKEKRSSEATNLSVYPAHNVSKAKTVVKMIN